MNSGRDEWVSCQLIAWWIRENISKIWRSGYLTGGVTIWYKINGDPICVVAVSPGRRENLTLVTLVTLVTLHG